MSTYTEKHSSMDGKRLAAIVVAAVAKSIHDAGLAKKTDLESLNEKITSTSIKADKIEARIEFLEEIAAENVRAGH